MTDYSPPKSSDELLRRYSSGERYFAESELDNANYDLRNVNLEGVDLSQSFITAYFCGANLRGANFSNSNVKTCDFSDADLRNADFSGAALEATTFKGAILDGANFAGASCYSRRFEADEKPWW